MKYFFANVDAFLLIISLALIPQAQAQVSATPQNAKDFLQLRYAPDGGGAGAGNGGGNKIVADFFSELGEVIKSFRITEGLSEVEIKTIRKLAMEVEVFPVEFALCAEREASDCSEEQSVAFQHFYPRFPAILIDVRNIPRRWNSLSSAAKQAQILATFRSIARVGIK